MNNANRLVYCMSLKEHCIYYKTIGDMKVVGNLSKVDLVKLKYSY